jgi:hypothetical protein
VSAIRFVVPGCGVQPSVITRVARLQGEVYEIIAHTHSPATTHLFSHTVSTALFVMNAYRGRRATIMNDRLNCGHGMSSVGFQRLFCHRFVLFESICQQLCEKGVFYIQESGV